MSSYARPDATGLPDRGSTAARKAYAHSWMASPSVPVGEMAPRSPIVKELVELSNNGVYTSEKRARMRSVTVRVDDVR
jgi:hypothetical protein